MSNKLNNIIIEKDSFEVVGTDGGKKQGEKASFKPIGFYRDAWNRFKRSKTSFVALIAILVLVFFTIVGPYLRNYTLPKDSPVAAIRLQYLPPKMPGLEKIGVFTGAKVVKGRNKEFIDSLPEGIVKKIVSEKTVLGVTLVDASVDYYRFLSYTTSVRNGLAENDIPYFNMTEAEFKDALSKNAILEVKSVRNGIYRVRVDLFQWYFEKGPTETYFWFGTTETGRDLFTELWKGAQITMIMALLVSVINIIIGLLIGSFVGYYGGNLDIVVGRIVDLLSYIPTTLIVTLLVIRFGSGLLPITAAFVLTGWIGYYGSTRSQFYRYKGREYVLAARSYGANDARIMFKHILPNAIGTLVTSFALSIPSFIFTESTYAYLGIVDYGDIMSVGKLLSIGQSVMQYDYHLLLFPAVYLAIIMISFNMFGNGLRDAFNPSLRGT